MAKKMGGYEERGRYDLGFRVNTYIYNIIIKSGWVNRTPYSSNPITHLIFFQFSNLT